MYNNINNNNNNIVILTTMTICTKTVRRRIKSVSISPSGVQPSVKPETIYACRYIDIT